MRALEELNEQQRIAASHREGPLLIIAGAGAGKTKTLTHRILNLIEHGVRPSAILAVTFTNKAAKEMRERILTLTGNQKEVPFISTFHALCVYILRAEATSLGYPRHFNILDKDESLAIVKRAFLSIGISDKEHEPRKILSVISREKNNLSTVEEYRARGNEPFRRIVAHIWLAYRAITKKEKVFDFDDLLVETVTLLRSHPDILERYRNTWQYIHVDEYQDTNTAQYELIRMLATTHRNLCVVGDADQSIYGWRGADFSNLLRFEESYPDATVVLLEENYRSTQTIIAAANEVIKKNTERREKTLFTKNHAGEKISLISTLNEGSEARAVAEKAREISRAKRIPLSEIAVLYRANFQSRILEEAFLGAGVPYRVLGVRFFERKEVRDMLAYLRAALNPEEVESVKRVFNVPKRGLGKVTLLKVFAGERETLPKATAQKVESFFTLLESIQGVIRTRPVSEVLKYILTESGWERELTGRGDEGQERLENLRELVTIAQKYDHFTEGEGATELLTDAALLAAEEEEEEGKATDAVRLMTVHAAKGLEFQAVFVVGLEQDLFPHTRINQNQKDIEEERRLFYVAITRARQKLFLSYAQTRTIYGSRRINIPSEFLFDISDDLIETERVEGVRSEDVIEWD